MLLMQALALVEEETRRYRPTKNYLDTIGPARYDAFEVVMHTFQICLLIDFLNGIYDFCHQFLQGIKAMHFTQFVCYFTFVRLRMICFYVFRLKL